MTGLALGLGMGLGNRAGLDSATVSALAAMSTQPSVGQAAVLNTLIVALKVSGVWAKTDWLVLRRIHDAQAARVNIRQPSQIGTIGSGTTFTANSEVSFNGTTDFIDDGFNPLSHSVAATGSNLCYWARETTNLAATSRVGGCSQASTKAIVHIPRSAGGIITSSLDCASTVASTTIADSRAVVGVQRESNDDLTFWAGGVQVGTAVTPGSVASVLPSINIFSGGYNVAGVLTSPRASHLGAQGFGGRLTSGEQVSLSAAIEAYLTAWLTA